MPTAGRHGNPVLKWTIGEEIGNRTSRSNSRVFKPEHRACSRNPRKRLFGLNSLILNGLTQLDDFRTRSGKNGEYGPNREWEAGKQGEFDRLGMERE